MCTKPLNPTTLSLCVYVCGLGKPYVMGTKYPHKDGNIRNPCPCGDIFLVPMRKRAYNHQVIYLEKLKMQKVGYDG